MSTKQTKKKPRHGVASGLRVIPERWLSTADHQGTNRAERKAVSRVFRMKILGEMLGLLSLAQNRIPYNKRIHLGTHEAAKRVLGRPNSGLATHIKARVDEDGAIGPTLRPTQLSQ